MIFLGIEVRKAPSLKDFQRDLEFVARIMRTAGNADPQGRKIRIIDANIEEARTLLQECIGRFHDLDLRERIRIWLEKTKR